MFFYIVTRMFTKKKKKKTTTHVYIIPDKNVTLKNDITCKKKVIPGKIQNLVNKDREISRINKHVLLLGRYIK